MRFELRRTGINLLERGYDAHALATHTDFHLRTVPPIRQLRIGETVFFGATHEIDGRFFESTDAANFILERNHLLQISQEPGVDVADAVNLFNRHPKLQGITQIEDALLVRNRQFALDLILCWLVDGSP